MNFRTSFKALALGSLVFASASSFATIIASTDFNDRDVSGTTASNLNWVTEGVSNPGDLSANFPLFNTTGSAGLIGVDRNLHNEGNWSVDVALNVLAENQIALTTVNFDAFILNNAGALQTVQRNLDFTVSLLDSALAEIFTLSVNDIYANSGSLTNGQSVVFDFTGNTLLAGESYTLRVTASGNGPGNNAGFDNFAVNGDVTAVSEPSVLAMFGLSFMLLMTRRFIK